MFWVLPQTAYCRRYRVGPFSTRSAARKHAEAIATPLSPVLLRSDEELAAESRAERHRPEHTPLRPLEPPVLVG